MIESPLIQGILTEAEKRGEARGAARGGVRGKHESLMIVLRARFRSVPAEVEASIRGIDDEALITGLIEHANRCRSMAALKARIPS